MKGLNVSFRKLKRYLLLYDLSEPFQIIDFIDSFENYYYFNDRHVKNIKILEVIKYFLEDDIFEIGEDYHFEKLI